MKDQYFGDVNDYRKYGLLRLLAAPGLRLGVCWMLTEPWGTEGKLLSYLHKPDGYRRRDPELFDWLKRVVADEKDRRTARIEESSLFRSASFQSEILMDDRSDRKDYFSECARRFASCDLVFFGLDNGLEINSVPCGRRNSSKFLYWDEVCMTFAAGASVMVYQHFPFEKRAAYIARRADELRERTQASAVFSFRTPHVLFLLASQERHVGTFRTRLPAIESAWGPRQIKAEEHCARGDDDSPSP